MFLFRVHCHCPVCIGLACICLCLAIPVLALRMVQCPVVPLPCPSYHIMSLSCHVPLTVVMSWPGVVMVMVLSLPCPVRGPRLSCHCMRIAWRPPLPCCFPALSCHSHRPVMSCHVLVFLCMCKFGPCALVLHVRSSSFLCSHAPSPRLPSPCRACLCPVMSCKFSFSAWFCLSVPSFACSCHASWHSLATSCHCLVRVLSCPSLPGSCQGMSLTCPLHVQVVAPASHRVCLRIAIALPSQRCVIVMAWP